MTPPKASRKVERLAEELWDIFGEHPGDNAESWNALARHVLRRERRARGRTVGYIKCFAGEYRVTKDTGIPLGLAAPARVVLAGRGKR